MSRAAAPLLALLALAGACATATGVGGSREYAGIYTQGFEVDSFQPCGSSEKWWVTDGEALRERYRAITTRPYQPVYAVVRGEASAPGRYGHLGEYAREIRVDGVAEVRATSQERC